MRAEVALRGRRLWKKLNSDNCNEDVKEHAAALLVGGLGNVPLRVCHSSVSDPINMLKLLDQRYASSSSVAIIALMTQVYSKRYKSGTSMAVYVDEFVQLFSQIEIIGDGCEVPEKHKAPILIANLGKDSNY